MSVSLSEKNFVDSVVPPSLENQKNVREILRTGSLLAVGLCSLGVMLVYLRFILVPLVLSRLFVFTLEPVVWFLEHGNQLGTVKIWRYCLAPFRFPHWMSVICTILFGLSGSALMVLFLSASVQQLTQESAKYQERILNFTSIVSQFAVNNGVKLDMQAYLQETLRSLPLASLTLEVARSAVTLFGDFFLMALFVIYMLAGIDYSQPKSKMQQHMSDQISRYLVAKLLLSTLTGVLTAFILFGFHVDLALVFSFFAFLLNFIPNVGSTIAWLLPLPILFLDPTKTWAAFFLVAVLTLSIHMLIGNGLEPAILGKRMHLDPVAVLVSLVFWSAVWGVVGAIISVPLTSVITFWLAELDHPLTRFVSQLLSGIRRTRGEKPDEEKNL